MQPYMIALIVVACVVAFLAVLFLVAMLVSYKVILGRFDKPVTEDEFKSFGIDVAWFDGIDNIETVEIKSFDGLTLRALLLRQPESSGKVAICQHGWHAEPRNMQPQAKIFYDHGFDVLLPAARAHGMSEGRACTMAWLERFDVLRWADKTVELFGESVRIALFGVSMGGASVVAAAGMNVQPQVKCVIDDCGFASQYDQYRHYVEHMPLASLALLPFFSAIRLFQGYSVREADIVPFARNIKIPALFIHGEGDVFVPHEHGARLYEACGSARKSMLSVPGAAHVHSYVTDPDKYVETFGAFIESVF